MRRSFGPGPSAPLEIERQARAPRAERTVMKTTEIQMKDRTVLAKCEYEVVARCLAKLTRMGRGRLSIPLVHEEKPEDDLFAVSPRDVIEIRRGPTID
jgi:hypothetical protein